MSDNESECVMCGSGAQPVSYIDVHYPGKPQRNEETMSNKVWNDPKWNIIMNLEMYYC